MLYRSEMGCNMRTRRKEFNAVLAVFLFAVIVQAVFVVESHTSPAFRYPLVDSATYHNHAMELASGESRNSGPFWQPPLYPFFLGVLYSLMPPDMFATRLLHGLVLGSAAAVLLYLLSRRLAGSVGGMICACSLALYGPWLFYSSQLLPTGLATVLGTGFVFSCLWFGRNPCYARSVLAGVLLGLGAITVPSILVVLPLAVVWIPLQLGRHRKGALGVTAAFLLAVAFCILPVTAYNFAKSGEFVPISTNAGINLYIGNNPEFSETMEIMPGFEWDQLTVRPYREGGADNAAEANAYFIEQTLQFIVEQPVLFAKGIWQKACMLLNSKEIPRNVDLYAFARRSEVLRVLIWRLGSFGFPLGILWPLALLGLVFGPYRDDSFKLLAGATLLYIFSIILFFPASRYLMPAVPWLIACAAAGVRNVCLKGRESRLKVILPAVVLVAFTILANLPLRRTLAATNHEAELETYVGAALQVRGRPRQALNHYRQAIQHQNSNSRAWFYAGTAWRELGQPTKAMEAQRQALVYNPENYRAMNELAVLLFRKQKYRESEKLLRKSLELNPGDPAVMKNLAVLLLKQGRLQEGRKWLRKARGNSP